MASTFETIANGVISVFNAEFAPEGLTMEPDKPHEALGRERRAAGIYPVSEAPMIGNRAVKQTVMECRVYDYWKNEIDPETRVNPFKITGWAQRFADALRNSTVMVPGTEEAWFFHIDGIDYPDDPTGNKTRFVMRLVAFSHNEGLVETS